MHRSSLRRCLLLIALVFAPFAWATDSVDALAQDVERLASLREVKDLQRSYVHLAQAGDWSAMAALFTRDGRFIRGEETVTGRAAIARWLTQHRGRGRQGLAPGALHFEMIDQPLANLSPDGETAKVRWDGLLFAGDGKGGTLIEGGIYENEYRREDGAWKIAVSRYYPQYEGDYEEGWYNVGNADLPVVPYHFTLEETGIPLPPASSPPPRSRATLAELQARVAMFNDEDEVANLQHAYGYYVDRRMWDDVVDLFAKDGVVVIEGVGRFEGPTGVRRAMERMGPAGLTDGILNDRPIFDTIVRVMPGGTEALSRGLELGQVGDANAGTQHWEFTVFRNRFVKEDGKWTFRELHLYPVMTAQYAEGWGRGGDAASAKRRLPELLGARAKPRPARAAGTEAERLTAARLAWARSAAREGTENVSAAYAFYIDDFQWPEMAGLFAQKGHKHSAFAGYYFGPERILGAVNANYGTTTRRTGLRAGIAYHWRTQPVIHVSEDGRSAALRTRLIQTATGKRVQGQPSRSSFSSGMYPNDQAVLENGVWRLWALEIDEHYMTSAGWKGGWSGVKPVGKDRPPSPPSRLLTKYPPDILMSAMGKRTEHFRGGSGETIEWPGIMPMWFHYRNPVSGREPPLYMPDCVPCEARPESKMTNHGYQFPKIP
jgi:hypothetical protein